MTEGISVDWVFTLRFLIVDEVLRTDRGRWSRFIAMLHQPPVTSPVDAVRATIVHCVSALSEISYPYFYYVERSTPERLDYSSEINQLVTLVDWRTMRLDTSSEIGTPRTSRSSCSVGAHPRARYRMARIAGHVVSWPN